MNRKELKLNAKKVFKRNYLKTVLVVFIIGLLLKGSYGFSTANYQETTNSYQPKNNYQLVNEVVTKISKKSQSGKSAGVIAPFFNKVTENESAVIGFLNAVNLFLLKEKVNTVILSVIGAIIVILLKILVFPKLKIANPVEKPKHINSNIIRTNKILPIFLSFFLESLM